MSSYFNTILKSKVRLHYMILTYIHKDLTDGLDLENIAKEFVKINERRTKYFGQKY